MTGNWLLVCESKLPGNDDTFNISCAHSFTLRFFFLFVSIWKLVSKWHRQSITVTITEKKPPQHRIPHRSQEMRIRILFSYTCTEVKWFWWISESYNSKPQWAGERDEMGTRERERERVHKIQREFKPRDNSPTKSSSENNRSFCIFSCRCERIISIMHLHIYQKSTESLDRLPERRIQVAMWNDDKDQRKNNSENLGWFFFRFLREMNERLWQLLTQMLFHLLFYSYNFMTTCCDDCDRSRRVLACIGSSLLRFWFRNFSYQQFNDTNLMKFFFSFYPQ